MRPPWHDPRLRHTLCPRDLHLANPLACG
ncbi:MAG: hypothetical protein QOG25_1121, partial [Acetobacteraceae bacterium]|nr:hypothetical protein [Acetobacteraceae bacterium]